MYYGAELTAMILQSVMKKPGIGTATIDSDSPWQNGYNERFNAVVRDNDMDRWWFASLCEARAEVVLWLEEYNNTQTHGAIEMKTPAGYSGWLRFASIDAA